MYSPDWLDAAVDLPEFSVLDTRSAQGRLDDRTKIVTVADLILFHGHACDGLLRGAYAMRALADIAFPKRPFDRTDLSVISKNSPCLGDVAAYLTGGRVRFGTHNLDNSLGVGFIIQVRSTEEVWQVNEDKDFFPDNIALWEAALLNDDLISKGIISIEDKAELVSVNEANQWNWVRNYLLPSRPSDHYKVKKLNNFKMPNPIYEAKRTDIVNRNIDSPEKFISPYKDIAKTLPLESTSSSLAYWQKRYDEGPAGI
jgi:formylmethanofuran dehydrogenase subunit E